MENTALEQDMGYAATGLTIDTESKAHLEQTAKWALFLSIIGFIFVGMMVLGGIFSTIFLAGVGGMVGDELGPLGGGMGAALGMLYIVFALLYLFPVLFMYRFSNKIKTGLRDNHQPSVTEAFRNLKKLYKYTGIFTIVIIALYLLMILGMGIFGSSLMF